MVMADPPGTPLSPAFKGNAFDITAYPTSKHAAFSNAFGSWIYSLTAVQNSIKLTNHLLKVKELFAFMTEHPDLVLAEIDASQALTAFGVLVNALQDRVGLLYAAQNFNKENLDEHAAVMPLLAFAYAAFAILKLPEIGASREQPFSVPNQPNQSGTILFSKAVVQLLVRYWCQRASESKGDINIATLHADDVSLRLCFGL